MKKRTIIISLICILSAIIIMIVFVVASARKPYKNLETVQIVCNGEILESYPAQLGKVYKITLLE